MALDNITIYSITDYLNKTLLNGRITKVNQPDKDQIILVIRNNNSNYKLILSSNTQYPLAYIDNSIVRENPNQPTNFCMILRKYISNGRIISINQIDYDRIIEFTITHYDEMGDLHNYKLIAEFMGKHSNIILINNKDRILDSIKHVDASTSSLRQIFPGANYFIVNKQNKTNILDISYDDFLSYFETSEILTNNIVNQFNLVSPKLAQEICYLSDIDSNIPSNQLDNQMALRLYDCIKEIVSKITNKHFTPTIYFNKEGKPIDYSVIRYLKNSDLSIESYDNINTLLINYYKKSIDYKYLYDKTTNIRNTISTNIKRVSKKLNIWEIQLSECKKKEKFKLYGELILAYSYLVNKETDKIKVIDYYTNKEVEIPIESNLSAAKNSQKYYAKYNKLKRTEIVTKKLIEEAYKELEYLQSINDSINYISDNNDINEIELELKESSYLKVKNNNRNKKVHKSKPYKFIDIDGNIYYVGRNNIQNEEVTFKIGDQNDWWFHIKDKPGSHVIVKNINNLDELPDEVYLQAAQLAGYYSPDRNLDKVEIDYIQRKFIKKPKNGHIGMVIYHTNYSIVVKPSIENLTKV